MTVPLTSQLWSLEETCTAKNFWHRTAFHLLLYFNCITNTILIKDLFDDYYYHYYYLRSWVVCYSYFKREPLSIFFKKGHCTENQCIYSVTFNAMWSFETSLNKGLLSNRCSLQRLFSVLAVKNSLSLEYISEWRKWVVKSSLGSLVWNPVLGLWSVADDLWNFILVSSRGEWGKKDKKVFETIPL